jgi:ribosomal peptide maturation radical SAM protein 1
MRYIGTLFSRLAESTLDLELFYEVKANLRYDQLVLLRAGGVTALQPGIESFSSAVLARMRKGCTGMQNVQLLRWCEELGIIVHWNILGGFPGESPDDYGRMAALLPLLTHLAAPSVAAPVRLDRYSIFYTQPDAFDITRIRPVPAYYYCYPLGRNELARLAYYFDFDYADGRRPWTYLTPVALETRAWGALRAQGATHWPRLDATSDGDGLLVVDTRPVATAARHALTGLAAQLYRACDSAHRPAALAELLDADPAVVRATADALIGAKLMIEMDGQLLSLAVFRDRCATTSSLASHDRSHSTQAADPVLSLV